MASGPIILWKMEKMEMVTWGKTGNSDRFYFLGPQKSLWMVTATLTLKDTCSLEENL